MPASHELTALLVDWSNGNQAALDKLMPLVDRELHRLAHHYFRRENAGHTLQTTALVNEAYLRLVDQQAVEWNDRWRRAQDLIGRDDGRFAGTRG